MMDNLIDERFRRVRSKNTSREALANWRNLCSVVKNPTRRFRFTANLEKRDEADAMRRTNKVLLFLYTTSIFFFYQFFFYVYDPFFNQFLVQNKMPTITL